MLAENFQLVLKNDSGATIPASAVSIAYKPHKFDAAGALEYTTGATLSNAGSINDGQQGVVGTVDNSTALNLGAHMEVTFNAVAGATGTVQLFLAGPNTTHLTNAKLSVTDITAQKILGDVEI